MLKYKCAQIDNILGKNLWLGHLIWTNASKLNETNGDYKFLYIICDIVESGSHDLHCCECAFIDQCLDQWGWQMDPKLVQYELNNVTSTIVNIT